MADDLKDALGDIDKELIGPARDEILAAINALEEAKSAYEGGPDSYTAQLAAGDSGAGVANAAASRFPGPGGYPEFLESYIMAMGAEETEARAFIEDHALCSQVKCNICGQYYTAVDGNPVNVLNGAKLESCVDMEILNSNIPFLISRAYDNQSSSIGLFGRSWSTRIDSRIIFGYRLGAGQAYAQATSSLEALAARLAGWDAEVETVKALYQKAIEAYQNAALRYGEIDSALGDARKCLNRCDPDVHNSLLKQAAEAIAQIQNMISANPKLGECADLTNALNASIDSIYGYPDGVMSYYNVGKGYLQATQGWNLQKDDIDIQNLIAELEASRDHFSGTTAPGIKAAIEGDIEELTGRLPGLARERDIEIEQKLRNQYVLAADQQEDAAFGSGMLKWIGENGEELLFRPLTPPDPEHAADLGSGVKNLWPEGCEFEAIYGRGYALSMAADGSMSLRISDSGRIYTYNPMGRLSRVQDRNGAYLSLSWEGGFPSEAVDMYGRWISFTPNDHGRIASISDFTGRSVSYGYSPDGLRLESFTDAENYTYSYAYDTDSGDSLERLTNPDSTYRQYEYEAFEYHGRILFRVTREWDEKNREQSFVYKPGRTIHTDRRGKSTLYEHDGQRHITLVKGPSGERTESHFTDHGDLDWTRDPAGYETTFLPDAEGHDRLTEFSYGGKLERGWHSVFDEVTTETLCENDTATPSTTEYLYYEEGPAAGKIKQINYPDPDTGTVDGPKASYAKYEYDELGRMKLSRDRNGAFTTYDYQDFYPLKDSSLTISAAGRSSTIVYDALGRIVSVMKGKEKTEYLLDDLGRATQIIQKGEQRDIITEYAEYSYAGVRIIKGPYYSDALPSLETEYIYTTRGEVERVIERESGKERASSFGYDEEGNLTRTTSPEGRIEWTDYDDSGRPSARGYMKGIQRIELERYAYDKAGRIESVSSEGAIKANYAYPDQRTSIETIMGGELIITRRIDGLGRLSSVETTSADGNASTSYYYDQAGRIERAETLSGEKIDIVSYAYDNEGRLITASDSDGSATSIVYDPEGLVLNSMEKEGLQQTYTYNAEGRLETEAKGPDTALTHHYDAFGRLERSLWPLGSEQTYSYDALGRLTGIKDRRGGSSAILYEDLGLKSSLTDPEGATTVRVYDKEGKLLTETDPRGATVTRQYDPVTGALRFILGAEGEKQEYCYDDQGYLTDTIAWAGSASRTTHYERDPYGRLTTKRDPDGLSYCYKYDASQRLRALYRSPIGGTEELMRAWDYDPLGNLVSERYLENSLVREKTYEYQADGDMEAAINYRGERIDYLRYASGSLKETRFPDGAWYRYQYDSAGRITRHEDQDGQGRSYQYDEEGNLKIDKALDRGGIDYSYLYYLSGDLKSIDGPGYTPDQSFEYDTMGRITRVNDKGDGDVSFDYDPAGNLTCVEYGARRKAITDYQYDLSGRMTGYKTSKLQGWKSDVVDGSAYAYDLFGDITSETKHDGAITIYQYDEADRLKRTINAGNLMALKARDIQE